MKAAMSPIVWAFAGIALIYTGIGIGIGALIWA